MDYIERERAAVEAHKAFVEVTRTASEARVDVAAQRRALAIYNERRAQGIQIDAIIEAGAKRLERFETDLARCEAAELAAWGAYREAVEALDDAPRAATHEPMIDFDAED